MNSNTLPLPSDKCLRGRLTRRITQDEEDEKSPLEDCFTPRLNETGLELFLVYFLA